MNSVTRLFVSGLLAAAVVSAAQAAIISGGTATVDPTLTAFNGPLQFDGFDTNLGTLDSVEIHAQSAVASVVELVNISKPVTKTITLAGKTFTQTRSQAADGTAYTHVLFNLLIGGSNLLSYGVDTGSSSYALANLNDSSVTPQLNGTSGDQSANPTASAILSAFSVVGSAKVSVDQDAASSVVWIPDSVNNGTVATNDFTAADLTVTVTYHYTPVPEPTTLGVLGLGAIFLGRRRHA